MRLLGDAIIRIDQVRRMRYVLLETLPYIDTSDPWSVKRHVQAYDAVFTFEHRWGMPLKEARRKVSACIKASGVSDNLAKYLELVTHLLPERTDAILWKFMQCRLDESERRASLVIAAGLGPRALVISDRLPWHRSCPTAESVRVRMGLQRRTKLRRLCSVMIPWRIPWVVV